jgi:hypothetical protein
MFETLEFFVAFDTSNGETTGSGVIDYGFCLFQECFLCAVCDVGNGTEFHPFGYGVKENMSVDIKHIRKQADVLLLLNDATWKRDRLKIRSAFVLFLDSFPF